MVVEHSDVSVQIAGTDDYTHNRQTIPGPHSELKQKERDWLRAQIESDPYVNFYELTRLFKKSFPKNRVHRSRILRAMRDLGFSFKKTLYSLAEIGLMFLPGGRIFVRLSQTLMSTGSYSLMNLGATLVSGRAVDGLHGARHYSGLKSPTHAADMYR